jgi:hypothetical protein
VNALLDSATGSRTILAASARRIAFVKLAAGFRRVISCPVDLDQLGTTF